MTVQFHQAVSKSEKGFSLDTSAEIKGVTVAMLRHVLRFYVREETNKNASAEIVNQHYQMSFSAVDGTGTISLSDS